MVLIYKGKKLLLARIFDIFGKISKKHNDVSCEYT